MKRKRHTEKGWAILWDAGNKPWFDHGFTDPIMIFTTRKAALEYRRDALLNHKDCRVVRVEVRELNQ